MIFKPLKHYCFVMFAALLAFTHPANAQSNSCSGKKIVFLGDSLFAGYGLQPGGSYPDKISDALMKQGLEPAIINAGVSGDTTTGGLARLDWSVGDDASGVVLELGANDALRGIPVDKTKQNLRQMIVRLKENKVPVLLMGMRAPPNMGEAYGKAFDGIFQSLADEETISLYPFFLDGVAGQPELNQADGIHPNSQGVAVIVERSLSTVLEFVKNLCG